MNSETCPHCGHSLQGEAIPRDDRRAYGHSTHYSRAFGHEIFGVYDGILFWSCPDCGKAWHRWPPGTELYARAAPYVNSWETETA